MEFKYTHNKISLLNLLVVIPRKIVQENANGSLIFLCNYIMIDVDYFVLSYLAQTEEPKTMSM